MRTLVFWDEIDINLQWFIVDGDWTRFKHICINGERNDEELKLGSELLKLVYNEDTGEKLITMSSDVSLIESKNWDKVIICGTAL
jgi:hypothetical protein